jgi:ATP-dependent Clp protease adaptor protein ClpS
MLLPRLVPSISRKNVYLMGMRMTSDPVRMSDPNLPGPPTGNPPGGGDGLGLVTQTRVKTKKPSLYRVLLLNDDYTPMEFVVYILERYFNRSREQATRIMLHVHQKGVGLCGVYTYEVAETKVAQVLDLAKRHEHPLQCVMEKDD